MPFLSRIFSSRPGAPGEHDHGGPSHTNAGVESAGAAESSEAGQHQTVNALPDETPTVGTSQVPERGNPAEDNHRHSRSGLDARRQSRMRSSRRSRYEISQAIRETDNEVRDLLAPHGLTPAALQEIHNRHSRLRNDVDRPLGVPIPIELPDESLMLANVATEDLPYMGTTVGAERVDMNEGHLPLSNPGNQVLGRVEQKVGRSPSHGRFSFLRKQSGRVKSMSGPGRCVSSSGEDEFGMPSKRKGNSARARPLSVDVINTCMTCGEKLTVPGHRTAYRCGRCKGVTDLEEKLDDILSKTLGEGFTTRGIWRVTAVPTNRPRNRPRNRPDVVYEEDEYDACESDVSDEPLSPLRARHAKDIADKCLKLYIRALASENAVINRRREGQDNDKFPANHGIPMAPSDLNPLAKRPNVHDCKPADEAPFPVVGRSDDSGPAQIPKISGDASAGPDEEQAGPYAATKDPEASEDHSERKELLQTIFKPLEVYLRYGFGNIACLNASFSTMRRPIKGRSRSEGAAAMVPPNRLSDHVSKLDISDVNGKTLLVGNVAENAALWIGGEGRKAQAAPMIEDKETRSMKREARKSPHIDWEALQQWYDAVLNVVDRWEAGRCTENAEEGVNRVQSVDISTATSKPTRDNDIRPTSAADFLSYTSSDLQAARSHVHRTFLKAVEKLLIRPGRLLKEPSDLRFLLITLANPLLHRDTADSSKQTFKHSNIIKRAFGLLAHCPGAASSCLSNWFADLPDEKYDELLSISKRYANYRFARAKAAVEHSDHRRDRPVLHHPGSLVRDCLHGERSIYLAQDLSLVEASIWILRSVCSCLNILWIANTRRSASSRQPYNSWYNLLLDAFCEKALIEDFCAWESHNRKFTFCSYPFLLSISAKIRILTFDVNRQQSDEARNAWYQQFTTNQPVQSNLHIHVRRDCLACDTLDEIRAVEGATNIQNEIKKGLRVHFKGEDGVDAGGLRKEFFMLLMRELLDPDHGLVVYDDDSKYCYFNPSSLEDSEQFYLLGTLIGLAIYNLTILDIPFAPVLFKKLLSSASHGSYHRTYDFTLDDLAQFRPHLAHGLQQLLDFDGDVEDVFCCTFEAEIDHYGERKSFSLVHNGTNTPVTNANRLDFVHAFVKFYLHDSVSKQFDPFKRGFFAVCGGNALSLFQPEELQLLVRGSAEPLDVNTLKAVAVYEGWHVSNPAETVDVLVWFWRFFAGLAREMQLQLLGFITGSDRVPALGETSLILRIHCAGQEESERLPVARTCFNILQLYNYGSEEKLQRKLWTAVEMSEGFLLK